MALVSIVTFVDSTHHIQVLHQALRQQSFEDWEWVVSPTGRTVLSGSIVDDPKVKLFHLPPGAGRLGWAERWRIAVEAATGDLIVDLDQHDSLLPNALEHLTTAAVASGAGAVYCDFAPATFEGHALHDGYEDAAGWQRFGGMIEGETFSAVRSFDATPSTLLDPNFSPGPALTWRRAEYERIRDSHELSPDAGRTDLLCHAYRGGVNFGHVNACLVISRRPQADPVDATVKERVADEHLLPLVEEWSSREGLALVELGGSGSDERYARVPLRNPDPRRGLPFEDDTVGVVRATDFLQHVNHCPDISCQHGQDGGPRCVVGMMNELYRILAPGGWLLSETPSSDGRGAFQDPTHCSFWNPNSFWYYTDSRYASLVPGVTCRFQAHVVSQAYPSEWHAEHGLLYVTAALVALEGQRQPGLSSI